MKKKVVKKLALSKETVSLISGSVVGGVVTRFCDGTNLCPSSPILCQANTNQQSAC